MIGHYGGNMPNPIEDGNRALKDYWLDENREFTADDTKAAYLIIRKGQIVSDELAKQYPGIEFQERTK